MVMVSVSEEHLGTLANGTVPNSVLHTAQAVPARDATHWEHTLDGRNRTALLTEKYGILPGASQLQLLKCDIMLFFLMLIATGVAVKVFGHADNIFGLKPRPFFLDDTSVWQEYKEGDTVPIWSVFVITYIGFSAAIGFGEFRMATRCRRLPRMRAMSTALRFAFGLWVCTMTSTMLVEWTKNYVGRLRPNFGERCLGRGSMPPRNDHMMPVGMYRSSSLSASSYSPEEREQRRVIRDDEECTTTSSGRWRGVWDGRRSFPSGHAALAMGAAVYTQLWLTRALSAAPDAGRAFCAIVLGILAIAYGLFVSASRVVDNAHHVSDIVGGMGIGAWMAAAHFWRLERETVLREQAVREAEALHAGFALKASEAPSANGVTVETRPVRKED